MEREKRDVVLGIVETPGGSLKKTLQSARLNREGLMKALVELRGNQRVTDPNPEDKFQALEKYGKDLTALARQGKIDPVIGRDEEIRRVMQVLSRRTKNNPVLIGEPGVGKTAIAEGLARRIVLSALKWARLRGARQAWLQVEAANRPARRLYEAIGFSEVYRYHYRRPPAA